MIGLTDDRVTVTVVSTAAPRDDLGDASATEVTEVVPDAVFAPQQIVERPDGGGVTIPARWYLPVPRALNSDDVIRAGSVSWRVLGGSSVWGNQTEVPVERTDSV